MAGSSSFAEPLHDYTYRPYNQEIIFIDWGSWGHEVPRIGNPEPITWMRTAWITKCLKNWGF